MFPSTTAVLLLGLAGACLAHGDHGGHGQKPMVDDNANWMTRHMAEEHHMDDFDAQSFFTLHDYDADGHWEADEILRTYGLMDESNRHATQERRDEIVAEVMRLVDADGNGYIDRAEWEAFLIKGGVLPDFNTGPGHHGDDEYEYEIHHWEKYHDENTKLEDLVHPEDIEHFKKHEQMEDQEDRMAAQAKMTIVEANIPRKFRRAH